MGVKIGDYDLDTSNISPADVEQLRKMFANFYPDSTPEEAEEFSAAVDDGEMCAAQVQGFFMFFKQSGRAAIENAFKLCSTKPKAEKSEQ